MLHKIRQEGLTPFNCQKKTIFRYFHKTSLGFGINRSVSFGGAFRSSSEKVWLCVCAPWPLSFSHKNGMRMRPFLLALCIIMFDS